MTTTGVATAAMALGLFGRKRRDDEQPGTDEELADSPRRASASARAADGRRRPTATATRRISPATT